MNRRWIHNDTPCRTQEDADAGYECEVVNAAAYDRLVATRDLLEIIVANAVVGPDPKMCGATDCYHVPLDDIDAAREWLQSNKDICGKSQ